MAKPLGPKNKLIRDTILANPSDSPAEIAKLINNSEDRSGDGISVTTSDVSSQKQILKKLGVTKGSPPKKKPGPAKGTKPAASKPAEAGQAELVLQTLSLAQKCGGASSLKRLVEKIEAAGY